jgi:CBS-domain-containing membrane protein
LINSHRHHYLFDFTGIVSERDYITKVALLGRTSKETPIKEIATLGSQIVTAKADETVESCMEKMMSKGIRHLPIVDDAKNVKGLISIKDLVKTVISEKEETIKVLSNFALGRGGHFGSE